MLGIKTVHQFLRFDLKEVLVLRGHGWATYRSLEKRAQAAVDHKAEVEANARPEPGSCRSGEPAEIGPRMTGASGTPGLSLETPLADITLRLGTGSRSPCWGLRRSASSCGLDLPRVLECPECGRPAFLSLRHAEEGRGKTLHSERTAPAGLIPSKPFAGPGFDWEEEAESGGIVSDAQHGESRPEHQGA